ncbi:two-component sensor histidine kinase [Shewanella mesophila]|uniref:sensor histidine kinase n=1 Tax=Shewanella mesophila TaxID=2864208 RepID=UPI001C660151|nr:ATP-binding protein [Shewanella mesophila]QYJ85431.1 two-component sensor histidine kinase [Shewanella mesophila]
MKRLFISLYLLLSLSFLGIGWTLDSLWQNNVEESGAADAPLIALAQLIAKLPKAERADYLTGIDTASNYPLQLLDKDKIALGNSESLTQTNVLVAAQDKEHELHFIKIDADQILMAGPIEIDPRDQLRGLFTLFFYLSLAFVALIWVWPLSRDLKILRLATKEFGQSNWDTQIQLSPRSQVQPLARTFNEMASHIRALIENQKHLSNAVSHEIRTPLARLKFALALMPQYCHPGSDEAHRQAFLDEMQQDVKEMENLLQELLTYASLESQRKAIQFERCDLIKLTQQTIKRLQGLHTISIKFECDIEQVEVMGDPSLIERALQNLIINAQRFANKAIVIKLTIQNKKRILSVIDDGPGIAAEDQSRIFEPFYRSNVVQNGNKGHGLGLAIIKRIMERHGGDVLLKSEPGQTQFTLSWPRIKLGLNKQT